MSDPEKNVTSEQIAEACLLHIDELLAPPVDINKAYDALDRIVDELLARMREMEDNEELGE